MKDNQGALFGDSSLVKNNCEIASDSPNKAAWQFLIYSEREFPAAVNLIFYFRFLDSPFPEQQDRVRTLLSLYLQTKQTHIPSRTLTSLLPYSRLLAPLSDSIAALFVSENTSNHCLSFTTELNNKTRQTTLLGYKK